MVLSKFFSTLHVTVDIIIVMCSDSLIPGSSLEFAVGADQYPFETNTSKLTY